MTLDALAAALPGWNRHPDALSRCADLDDDPGQIPATLRLTALGEGVAAPVAFHATLPVHVAPQHRDAARVALSLYSDAHVDLGLVDLSFGGAVRFRVTHAPLHPWAADGLDAFATDALAQASAVLASAWRSLDADGVSFADVPPSL